MKGHVPFVRFLCCEGTIWALNFRKGTVSYNKGQQANSEKTAKYSNLQSVTRSYDKRVCTLGW